MCHDAGKPESEYKSHWVKDLKGTTICPTLLSLECRYCFKPGHTVKFCDVLLAKNKEVTKTAAKAVPSAAKKPAAKKRFNCFEALDYDSDKEEETEEKEAEPEVANTLTGWAAIAAKPKSVEQPKPNMIFLKRQPILTPKVVEPIKVETAPQTAAAPQTAELVKKPFVFTKSWADLSDSEDEDDIESDVGNDAWD